MTSIVPQRKRPSVLLIAYQDSRSAGGSLRVLETLAKSLPSEGFDVEIVFAYGDGAGVAQVCGCPVQLIKARSAYDISAWRRVRSLTRKREPAIIQFVDNVNWIMLAILGIKIPKLSYAHGRPIWSRHIIRRWVRSTLQHRLTDGVVTISYGVKRSLVSLGLVSAQKAWVVQNGLDPRFLDQATEQQENKISKPISIINLGMACRLTIDKGVLDAVRLMRFLPNNWQLVIAGEGPARDDLLTSISEHGLVSRVTLLGNVENMEKLYGEIDYYLFLTRYEPFGLVLAEAMYSGVPVVGLRGDGEYAESEWPLIDTSVALMLSRNDPFDYDKAPSDEELKALATSVLDLQKDTKRKQTMTCHARERVRTGFMASHQARKLADVYRCLLSCAGDARSELRR